MGPEGRDTARGQHTVSGEVETCALTYWLYWASYVGDFLPSKYWNLPLTPWTWPRSAVSPPCQIWQTCPCLSSSPPLSFGAKTTPSAHSWGTPSQNSGSIFPLATAWIRELLRASVLVVLVTIWVPPVASTPWAGVVVGGDPRSVSMRTSAPITELAELIFVVMS